MFRGLGPVDILGDMVVVLDENLQVVWTWNGFDHLDVTRAAILGETCLPDAGGGCPPVLLDSVANDWMHSNAITYDPTDGNLLLSMRHQDWIIKIDYADGLGVGDVSWRLGPEGDFTIDSADPFPWFSHQHDPNFDSLGQLAVFDNGNTRCSVLPAPCNSRGQVYQLDEQDMTAALVVNADLGTNANAVGSAQPLDQRELPFRFGDSWADTQCDKSNR